jgi:outer membrane protein assembly factor BamA
VAADGLVSYRSGDPGVSLPFYLEFGLGGANTVRGWPLGARIGRNQLLGSAEYQFAVLPPRGFRVRDFNLYGGVHLAAFADWGLVWTDSREFSRRNGIGGYGVGLRLFMPFVDLVRVDVARGEPGRGASVSVGIDFKANRQRERVR